MSRRCGPLMRLYTFLLERRALAPCGACVVTAADGSDAMHAVARLVNCCLRCETCFDRTVRTAGPGYVLAAWVLILGVIWVFFRILMPLSYDTSTPEGMAHLALGVAFSFNILFNYAMCVRSDPGSPPDIFASAEDGEAAPGSAGLEAADSVAVLGAAPGAPRPRWCRKCRNTKPPLAHHCTVCGRCVLKMDHHCPWMNNCVGLRNYRYFFLFLFYLWGGCFYACMMCYGPVAEEPDLAPLHALLSSWRLGIPVDAASLALARARKPREMSESQRSAVLFSCILAGAVFLALSVLLFWHVYLVLSAQTTIDYYGNREAARVARRAGRVWVNEFDLGWRRNWQETFDERGPFWWIAWAAPRLRRHRGDGLCFPTAREEEAKRGSKDEDLDTQR